MWGGPGSLRCRVDVHARHDRDPVCARGECDSQSIVPAAHIHGLDGEVDRHALRNRQQVGEVRQWGLVEPPPESGTYGDGWYRFNDESKLAILPSRRASAWAEGKGKGPLFSISRGWQRRRRCVPSLPGASKRDVSACLRGGGAPGAHRGARDRSAAALAQRDAGDRDRQRSARRGREDAARGRARRRRRALVGAPPLRRCGKGDRRACSARRARSCGGARLSRRGGRRSPPGRADAARAIGSWCSTPLRRGAAARARPRAIDLRAPRDALLAPRITWSLSALAIHRPRALPVRSRSTAASKERSRRTEIAGRSPRSRDVASGSL
jgi:hypothetical protein